MIMVDGPTEFTCNQPERGNATVTRRQSPVVPSSLADSHSPEVKPSDEVPGAECARDVALPSTTPVRRVQHLAETIVRGRCHHEHGGGCNE